MRMTGGCLCGAVRYSVRIADADAYLCHCRMCRRATGSVSIAFKNVAQADVTWESGPDWYRSSPFAERPFCARCGTSLGFRFLEGENMDLTVASFDDAGYFRCTSHFGVESRLDAWLWPPRDLPEKRTDEHPVLVEKWMNALGKLPD